MDQVDKFTGDEWSQETSQEEVPKERRVTAKRLFEMLQSQGFRCAMTGRKLDPDTAEVDHIVPYAMGGKHDIGNVMIVHRDANRAKGTMTLKQFLQLCEDVVKNQRVLGK